MHQRYTLADYGRTQFPDELMLQKRDVGMITLVLADGEVVLPARLAIINMVLFEPLHHFGIVPTSKDILWTKTWPKSAYFNHLSRIYTRILAIVGDNYALALTPIWNNINRWGNFSMRYCRDYVQTIDVMDLCKLVVTPGVKELADMTFRDEDGTQHAEERLLAAGLKLRELLRTRGALQFNPLIDLMETEALKEMQLPTMLIAYGARSDINDVMAPHIISNSAMQGLRSVADYSIENLSAKKSSFNNKSIIKLTQYHARKMRIAMFDLIKVYPGDCGNRTTIPIQIPVAYQNQWMHKVIIVDGKEVVLTKTTLPQYAGKFVNMVTPMTCRHTDGFCAHCAGRGRREVIRYLPKNIHIGIHSSSKVTSKVSQLVLSSKHLIVTKSKMYVLPEAVRKYFFQNNETILWTPGVHAQAKKWELQIPLGSIMGHLTDLTHETLPDPEMFSRIKEFNIVDAQGNPVETIEMLSNNSTVYLTEEMLRYIKDNYSKISVELEHVVVPLNRWDFEQPMMRYIVVNDDMIAFTERVQEFFEKNIQCFTSASTALQTITDLIYSKTKVNVFWIEVVLRAFMCTSEEDTSIPVVIDPAKCQFTNIAGACSNRSLSAKMAYERLEAYFCQASTFTKSKGPGLGDALFGLNVNNPKRLQNRR